MRVLFISSNPEDETTLNLNLEITQLEQSVSPQSPNTVSFQFLPALPVEKLPVEVAARKPDILHISIHLENGALMMTTESGNPARIDASMLSSWFYGESSPRVIYLNACDSKDMANELTKAGYITIGHSAPINNGPARSGAVTFYKGILSGESIQTAFESAKKMVEALQQDASLEIFAPQGLDPRALYLHPVPRLLARLKNPFARPFRDGRFSVYFGAIACPPSTTQVVFFTDDEADATNGYATVVRRVGHNQSLWMPGRQSWKLSRNIKVFAAVTTHDDRSFIMGTFVKDAILKYYQLHKQEKIPQNARDLLLRMQRDA